MVSGPIWHETIIKPILDYWINLLAPGRFVSNFQSMILTQYLYRIATKVLTGKLLLGEGNKSLLVRSQQRFS